MLQLLSGRIQQQNAEHLVVNQPAQQFGNSLEQLIEVKNRRQLTSNFIEQQQRACLPGGSGVKPRVLYADGHARRNESEQLLVFFSEMIRLERFDVDHADHTVLND